MSRTPEQVAAIVKLLQRYGDYELMPLRGKIPTDRGWRTRDYSNFDLSGHLAAGGNIGIRLQARDLIIDCDPRNYRLGHEPLKELCASVGIDLTAAPATETGGGGLHLFFRKPPELRTVGHLKGFDGLDFLTEGKFIVAPGSVHPETGHNYKPRGDIGVIQEAPAALLEMLRRREETDRESEPGVLEVEELEMLLKALDPRDYGQGRYLEWIALGAACHDATNGQGLDVWLDWCASDEDYQDHDAVERAEAAWNSFKAGRKGGATYRTLFYAVEKAGRGDLVAAIRTRRDFIEPDAVRAEDNAPIIYGSEEK